MNTRPLDPHPTEFDSPVAEARRRFLAGWLDALRGGHPPSVDQFLVGLGGRERDSLRAELLAFESVCQQMRQHAASASPDFTVNDAPAQPGAETIDEPPAVGSPTHVPVGGATVEYRPAPIPSDTLDPEEGRRTDERRKAPRLPVVPGYKLLGVLGRGGMGVVYRARQEGLDRIVALKMILAGEHAGPQQLARFQAEAQAVAQLQHSNIVQIYEVGKHEELPYFSLEFVDGGSLAEKLDHKPQPAQTAAELIETLARAMHYAHQHGIVHRDLKPANVLLQTSESGLQIQKPAPESAPQSAISHLQSAVPKITDFGLAKRLEGDSSQTRTGTIMGSPSYMAPEQARGEAKEVGPPADVHALGAMLYEMLTGRPPYLAATAMDTVMAVLKEEPVPPSRLQPRIPRDIETICLKCLQKEPEKRYISAAALADDLRRFLNGEPIEARPVSSAERLWRWCQRNPRVAVLSALVLLLLAGVAVGSTVFSFKLATEKKSALDARDAEKTAKEQAQVAEVKATESAQVARAQSDLAVESLATLLREVQQKLADRPDVAAVRQDIIKVAMDRLTQVEKGWVTDAGKTERSMAAAYVLMGDLLWEAPNQRAKAAEYYQRCYDLVSALAKANPGSDKARKNLAVATQKMGDVGQFVKNDLNAAREHYERSRQALHELAAKPKPGDELTPQEIASSLGVVLGLLSQLEARAGRIAAARSHAENALALYQEWHQRDAKNPDYQLSLAATSLRLADLCFRLSDKAASQAHLQLALKLHEQLYEQNRSGLGVRRGLSRALADAGDLELRQGEPALAEPLYRRHVDIAKQLADFDSSLLFQRELALAYYRLATAKLMLGRTAESTELYRDCLKLREKLDQLQPTASSRMALMVTLARCGEHTRAIQLAEELRAKAPTNPSVLTQVACTYALGIPAIAQGRKPEQLSAEDLELQKKYATEAMAALTRATAGPNVDLVSLDTDPDLAPLRKLPAYEQWKQAVRTRAAATSASAS
jgi:serine/threonine protein kinase/tetratricopeptide (TPR) repeat protein